MYNTWHAWYKLYILTALSQIILCARLLSSSINSLSILDCVISGVQHKNIQFNSYKNGLASIAYN